MPPGLPPTRASEAARLAGARLAGPDRDFRGVAPAERAGPDDLAWADRPARARASRAGVLVVAEAVEGRTCIVADDPRLAFARLLAALFPEVHEPGVHPGAFVHPTARLGRDVVVYPGAYVGPDCEVGDRTVIFPNAVLYPGTVVGPDCRVHAGAVLGADGFAYQAGPEGPVRVPQLGRTRLGARVEVGANACVDRAGLEETVVEDDVKIDNLVQVGHNCRVGRGSVLAAQVGLSGSVEVGEGVAMAGQVGIADHVRVGPGARVGAKAGVHRDLEGGRAYLGIPAMPVKRARRVLAALQLLPELVRRVRALERGRG